MREKRFLQRLIYRGMKMYNKWKYEILSSKFLAFFIAFFASTRVFHMIKKSVFKEEY